MDMKADIEAPDQHSIRSLIGWLGQELRRLGNLIEPFQLPPTLSKASIFHLEMGGVGRVLHSTVMPDNVDHQGPSVYYRRLREHWFLKSGVDWNALIGSQNGGSLKPTIEVGSYPTVDTYEADSSFQFRCKPLLSSTDWQSGPKPALSSNTLAFEIDDPNCPQGETTVSHVAFELESVNGMWTLRNLVWFSTVTTPHPLFDGNPVSTNQPITLTRKKYSDISAGYFFDEHITSP